MASATATWRDVDGILLLDKPAGLSSNQALQRARRLFQARKAGHTGTLDPFATGMLALCFGQATKVGQVLLEAPKRYQVTARLGQRTDTGDPEGEVIERQPVPDLEPERLRETLAGLEGEIEQVPPMHSAVKHQGQRLYDLARQGREVERKPRRVTLDAVDFEAWSAPTLRFSVTCSKGTYIRVLVEDIAERLGTVGYTRALRRTGIHPFMGEPMWTLDALEAIEGIRTGTADHRLLGPDRALVDLPSVTLDEDRVTALQQGRRVVTEASGTSGTVRVYGPRQAFIGIGQIGETGELRARRLMAVGGH